MMSNAEILGIFVRQRRHSVEKVVVWLKIDLKASTMFRAKLKQISLLFNFLQKCLLPVDVKKKCKDLNLRWTSWMNPWPNAEEILDAHQHHRKIKVGIIHIYSLRIKSYIGLLIALIESRLDIA